MKIMKFNTRITKTNENLNIPIENHENHENHCIPKKNHENHENLGISERLMKIMKKKYNSTRESRTKNILEFHARFTKIMKILEFN